MPILMVTLPMYWALWGAGLAFGAFGLLAAHGSTAHGRAALRLSQGPVHLLLCPRQGEGDAPLAGVPRGHDDIRVLDRTAGESLLAHPLRLFVACAVIATGLLARVMYSWWTAALSDKLVYDESVEPTIQTLGIMPDV